MGRRRQDLRTRGPPRDFEQGLRSCGDSASFGRQRTALGGPPAIRMRFRLSANGCGFAASLGPERNDGMPPPTADTPYPLGATSAEHARLIRQAVIWDPFT